MWINIAYYVVAKKVFYIRNLSLIFFSLSRSCFEQRRNFNANRAVVTRVKRTLFSRLYPTTLVNPDGSTVRIKYPTPRILVKLPLDFTKLDSEMQRKIRLLRQSTVVKEKKQEVKVAFDPLKYVKSRKWTISKLSCERQNKSVSHS